MAADTPNRQPTACQEQYGQHLVCLPMGNLLDMEVRREMEIATQLRIKRGFLEIVNRKSMDW
jgi:hypothetical protein